MSKTWQVVRNNLAREVKVSDLGTLVKTVFIYDFKKPYLEISKTIPAYY